MTEGVYGTPPAYTDSGAGHPAGLRRSSGMATAALVIGIVGLLTSWTVIGGVLLGLLAIILGTIAARRAGRGETDGRGRAIWGVITGAVGLVLAIALIAFGVSLLNSTKVKNLESCLKSAGNNQSSVQQCKTQYQNSK